MSGTKRSYDDGPSRNERREKPQDWRDAFLEDDKPRRDRPRPRERDDRRRDDHRTDRSARSNHDDRRGNDARKVENTDRYRDRDHPYDREGGRSGYRDREHDREPRRFGDRDGHRHDDRARPSDREEGEIETSPTKPSAALPASTSSPRSPARALDSQPPIARGGFRSVAIPSGPKSRVPQTRPPPPSGFQAQDRSPQKPAPPVDEEPVVVLEEEKDPEQLLEERRRKRAEIMAKFKANGNRPAAGPVPNEVILGTGADSITSGGMKTAERVGVTTGSTTGATPLLRHLGTKSSSFLTPATIAPTPLNAHEPSLPATPHGADVDLTKGDDDAGRQAVEAEANGDGAGISAADYDPTLDKKDDEEKRRKDIEQANGIGEPIVVEDEPPAEDEYEEVEIEEEEEDDDLDMFAAFGDEEKPKKKRKVMVRRRKGDAGGDAKPEYVKPKQTVLDVVDNVDDTDGYYRITPGEILDDGRYQITITLGKGMFSAVVKAKVLKAVDQERRQDVVGKEVAIKVIRSQESMYVAGRKEAQILKKLNDADPEDKKHIVRMERQFEHRGHLCIVTESLSMNLRDVIKRFGKDVGLNMRAVRAYAHQMFLALTLMRKCNVVHADIKPDNILVSENKAVLKICDLGSASDVSEGDITPYLVSRFYRAPEIILGLPYDTAIDIWSVGCTLYELYTGKILFPGRSNNHMLLLMMEVKGKISHRLIKKASLGEMYFDETNNFISIEKEKITGQDVVKTLAITKATRDLRSRLLPNSSVQLKMKDDELKLLQHFIDLLEKCTHLDPARRITPREALLHPFLAGH